MSQLDETLFGNFAPLTRQNKMTQRSRGAKGSPGFEPLDEASRGSQQFNLQNQVKIFDSSDKKNSPLQTLKPSTLQALNELISLVHKSVEVVNQNDITQQTSHSNHINERKKNAADDLSLLEEDPVAKIILPVEPPELRSMLLAMVHTFPRTLEVLVLNLLGTTGAEILTTKFDEMDQQTTKEEQSEFYRTFYSVFDDQFAAMDALLNGKELFSFQVFRNVLDQYLRVHVHRPS